MHPRTVTLIALCDAELDARRSGRIARHVRKCEKCREELRRIEREKDFLSGFAEGPAAAMDVGRGLAAMLSTVAGLQGAAAPELRSRVRAQIATYFGSGAASMIERPEIRADELLGKALGLVAAFLGPSAADAVADEIVRGLAMAQD